jgi:hypothetical protein
MSMTNTLLRRLTTRLSGASHHRIAAADLDNAPGIQRHAFAAEPLQWRAPWQAWQFLSWVTVTLLAPPFWMIGVLLMINAHSDQPLFWPATMAIVAITNVMAIMLTNQRHHRRPFAGHMPLALHYFSVSMATGGALLLLLIWGTGILQDFAGPLAATAGAVSPLAAMLWTAAVTASFGVLSFTHASVLHAWLAFEA